MAYTINFTYVDKNGQEDKDILQGPHRGTLSALAAPLDVSLVEVPNPDGSGEGTLNLTLTAGKDGPRSDIGGTWPYQVMFAHQTTKDDVDQASVAAGSSAVQMNPGTDKIELILNELPPKDDLKTRLFFTLKDV